MLGPLAAYQVFESNAVYPQFLECSLAVELPSGGVSLLPVLDFAGGVLDERRRRPAVKPPTADQGAGGGMDLAHRQLGIFSPAACRGLAPGTSNSRR